MKTVQRESGNLYTTSFFETRDTNTRRSAQAVTPWIIELFQPRSVVDIGCGTGHWLSAFMAAGMGDLLGIDGEYVPRDQLSIPEELFVPHDLSAPILLKRTFDMAISLEVAEHLPPQRADSFVEDLCKLAPVVVFSAAIPHQGGTGHVNEQWPDYWANLFRKRGRLVLDCVREPFWSHPEVACHYAQNTLVYVTQEVLDAHPGLARYLVDGSLSSLARVHPVTWHRAQDLRRIGLRRILRAMPSMLQAAIRKRLA
jgi:SAM-dependent methyltransferase